MISKLLVNGYDGIIVMAVTVNKLLGNVWITNLN